MIKLSGSRFTDILPENMASQPEAQAFAAAVGQQVKKLCAYSDGIRVWAAIDSVPEKVLNYMAIELRTPGYDENFPIGTKRKLVSGTIEFHMKMGTVYAVKTALGSVHPQSEIEEWFQYDGKPFHFRVVLDVTSSKAPEDYFTIQKAVDCCKRLSAHMESLIYQCRALVQITITTDAFFNTSAAVGRGNCGTTPQRSVRAGLTEKNVAIYTDGKNFATTSTVAGTVPQRATMVALRDAALTVEQTAQGFIDQSTQTGRCKTGTEPHRRTGGRIMDISTVISSTVDEFSSTLQICGTVPQTATSTELNAGGIAPVVTAECFTYHAKRCGTAQCKHKQGS
ncbi:MAG: phage tail protein I [Oscillibacter sp.]